MRWLPIVRSMPLPVASLTLIFLGVPLLSTLVLSSPAEVVAQSGWLLGIVHALAFWAIPFGISFSLLRKHHWFLPLYFLQCVFLTVQTILSRSASTDITLARVLLIGMMLYVGVLMGNRNFLYPLLTKQFRFWRRSVRYRVGRTVKVTAKGSSTDLTAVLFDCSATGLQLSIPPQGESEGFAPIAQSHRLEVHVPGEETRPAFHLAVEVAWIAEGDGRLRVGCRALDTKLMKAYVTSEVDKQTSAVALPVPRGFMLDQDIQETAIVLWLACIALSFALPALG